jgi:bla regulator protein blaR1
VIGWMLYAVAAAAALGSLGLLAERGLSLLGRPVRWTWLLAMLASVTWPFVSGPILGAGGGFAGDALTPAPAASAGTGWRTVTADYAAAVPDTLLLGVWALASAALFVVLLLSAEALRGDERRWRRATVAGERVFLSPGLGPAVIGTLRPRIVIPAWVLELDQSQQRLIVLHERAHVRSGDSRLLTAVLVLLVLLPWCLPLWWQLHRLRLAVEMDCDRRLLHAGAPAHDYAQLLLAVARQRRRVALPLAAMASSKAALRRRIRMIVARPSPGSERLALALLTLAALLPVAAVAVAAPPPPPPSAAALIASLRYPPPPVNPDGLLPGDPGGARVAAELLAHHGAAIAAGLPEGSVVWFVVDRAGTVVRTGIERGTDREVEARVRARYPGEASGRFALGFEGTFAGVGAARVLWLMAAR